MFRIVFGRRKIISRRFAGDVDLAKLVPLLPKDCAWVWEMSPRKTADENSKIRYRLEKTFRRMKKVLITTLQLAVTIALLIWVFHARSSAIKWRRPFTKRITGGLSPLSSPTSLLKSLPLSGGKFFFACKRFDSICRA